MSGLQFTDATATSERPNDKAQIVPGETWLRGPDDPIRSKITHTFFNQLKANFNKLITHYGSDSDGDDMLLNAVRNAAEPYSYISTIGPPTTSDNAANASGRGVFVLGSKWYDKNNSEVYRCLDPISGLWVKTSLTLDELGSAAALDAGTEANELVQLNENGKLPPVDGSQLTNLPETSLTDNSVTSQKLATNAVTSAKIALNSVTSNKIADASIIASKLGIDVANILQVKYFADLTDYTRTSPTFGNMGNPFIVTPKSTTSSLLVIFTADMDVTETASGDDLGFYVVPHYYRGSDTTYYEVGTYMRQLVTNLDGSSAHSFRAGNSSIVKLDNIDDHKYNGDWYVRLRGQEHYSGTGTIWSQYAIALEVGL